MNNDYVTSMYKFLYEHTFFISLEFISWDGIDVNFTCNFLRNCQTVSKAAEPFYISANTSYFSFSNSHSNGCAVVCCCGFDFYFHND